MAVLLLIFWGIYTIFYNRKWLHQFTCPPTVHKGSFCSTFNICIPCSFDNRHHPSIRWYLVVVSIWIFSIIRDAKYLFMYFLYDTLFVYTLEKMSVQALCPFLTELLFFFILGCISSLDSLDINSLMGLWFANIVSYSISCFFILLMVSFAVQKLLVICHPIYFFIFLHVVLVSTQKK